MLIRISPDDGLPIYLQIVNQVKYLVAAGRLTPGEELPAIRVLADRLTVNPNTAPTLSYVTPQSVVGGGNLTINPASGPADNGSISTIVVQSTGGYTGGIAVMCVLIEDSRHASLEIT